MNFLKCTYAYHKKEDNKTVYYDSEKVFFLNPLNIISFEQYYDYPNVLKVNTLVDDGSYPLYCYCEHLSNIINPKQITEF